MHCNVLPQGPARKLVVFVMMAALLLSLLPQPRAYADGNVYYVGGAGASDANPGSESEPFATIQQAANVATAGDTVKIREGVYRETVVPANSGSVGSPIVFQPDGDAVVTVSGTDAAEGGWTVYSGNIYKKAIELPVTGYRDYITGNETLIANQVFVDSKMMIEARWPNVTDSDDLLNRADYRDGKAGTWTAAGATQKLSDAAIPAIDGGWAGGTLWANGWFISQTRSITADTGTQLTLAGNPIDSDFRDYYYLTGKLGALDTAKEWFYDGTDLYLWMPNGESPSDVEVKMRNYAFDLSGKSYITVQGIDVFASTITTDEDSSNITLDGLRAKYINHSVTTPGSDLNYTHNEDTGIRLIGPDSIIKNSIIEYSSEEGIVLGEGNIAENNVVHDVSYGGNYASGISPVPDTSGQKILHNSIYRTGRSSINLPPAKNVEIGYNDLYDFGLINTDTGAIYSARNSDLDGTRIHHNWIHDPKADLDGDGLVAGIYYDQGAGPTQVDHNVLWGNDDVDLYVQHESTSEQVHHIYNNTFVTNATASFLNFTTTPKDFLNNNIYRDQVIGNTTSSTDLTPSRNPKFVNEGDGGLRFRLQESSPAVDAAAEIAGVTDGYIGDKPDIGAYEFGGEDWIAGYIGPDWSPDYENPDASTPDTDDASGAATAGKITINDADIGEGQNQFNFVGNWGVSPEPGSYQDNEHFSGETDAYYEVKFTGTQVKVYAQKNHSFGIAAISVDGGPEKLVDGYSPTKIHNTLLYSSETLPLGEHVLKVRVTGTSNVNADGTYHVADRVVITTGTLEINDAETGSGANQFEFAGTWGVSPETGAFMDNEHYSDQTDAYYQVRFVGTQAKLFAQTYKSLGIVAVSVDGGEETLVDCYSPTKVHNTLLYASEKLEYGGHVLKVRITGQKNEAAEHNWHSADRVQIVTGFVPYSSAVTINDMDTGTELNQFDFHGTWGNSPEPGSFMDNEHFSNETGAYYQIRFTGTQARVFAQKYLSQGIVGISVDGGEETLVDTYSPVKIHNTLVYTSPVLENGEHVVKVRVTGTKNAASNNTYHSADRVVITTLPVYEAEEASVSNGAGIQSEQTGYTGSGYLGGFGGENASSAFTVNPGTAGDKKLTLRYANGNETAAGLSLYVNGEKAKQLTLPGTTGWNVWDEWTETIALNAGDNEIAFKVDPEDAGNVLLDSINVPYEEPGVPPPASNEPDPGTPPSNQFKLAGTPFGTDGTWGPPGDTYDKVFDGDTSSFFDSTTATGAYAGLDLGSGNAKKITSIKFYPRESEIGRMNGGKFQGSNTSSDSGFTDLYTVTSTPASGWNEVTISDNTPYRYLRYIGGTDSYGNVSEVEFYSDSVLPPAPNTQDPAPGTVYEAEDGTLDGGTSVNTDHAGYSGTGFVDHFSDQGASVTFTVNAAMAGERDVTLRYANGNPASSLTIYVNGTKFRQTLLPGLADWDAWGFITDSLHLKAGENTITYKYDSGDAAHVNLDYVSVARAPEPNTQDPAPGTKYEAEEAALDGGTSVNTDHAGYSGTGFVDHFSDQGASVTFTVNAAMAGERDVTLRYANGNPASSLSIYVNGKKFRQTPLPGLADWDAWGFITESLHLAAGENTITYKYDSGDGAHVNLDYISVARAPEPNTQDPAPGTKYEAEEAALDGGTSVNTDHAGYSGTGFVDHFSDQGASVAFKVNAATAGAKDVTLRYANGNPASSLTIYVNGTKIKQTPLPGLADWDAWGFITESLHLAAGENTIAYKYDSGDGAHVNLDYISVAFDPAAPTPVPTPTPTPTPSGTISVPATVDGNGKAVANIGSSALNAAIDGSDDKTVHIEVTGTKSAKAVTVNIPADSLKRALDQEIDLISIDTGLASVTVDTGLLDKDGVSGELRLTIAVVDPATLSKDARQTIGNQPVYDFGLSVGGQTIDKFGGNDVSVSVPYTLKPGEKPNKIIIYHISNEGKLEIVKNAKYDEKTGTVTFRPKHFSLYAVVPGTSSFVDVGKGSWSIESIEALAARGIVQGLGEGKFLPSRSVTRAEFAVMLANAFEWTLTGDKASFSDVSEGSWYEGAVAASQRLGIVQGYPDGTFDPDGSITRQEMAVMLYRAASALGVELKSAGSFQPFADQSRISAFAKDAVEIVHQSGVMGGFGNGNFLPQAFTTREQAAAVLWKILQKN
ncbi:CBM35 domain-containing protein [Paenibacillus montanisoli]|nr:CBM35 domain-containing protein [Paenibacillus montanisoli]